MPHLVKVTTDEDCHTESWQYFFKSADLAIEKWIKLCNEFNQRHLSEYGSLPAEGVNRYWIKDLCFHKPTIEEIKFED